MKYIIRQSRIEKLIMALLDDKSNNWGIVDMGAGDFDIVEGNRYVIRYRTAPRDKDYFLISPRLVWTLDDLFGLDNQGSAGSIIKWLNKKYNLNVDEGYWDYIDEYREAYYGDDD